MINEIFFPYPSWYLLLCLLLGIGYAVALYYRDGKFADSPRWVPRVMSILRTLGVTGIAVLLLSPLFRTVTEEIKQPVVVIAEDNSQSIVADLSEEQIADKIREIDALEDGLSQKYDVKRLTIGDEIRDGGVDSFSAQVTNLSESLEFIYDNYGDQNLGAIILSTDGIYNEGKNPLYANVKLTAPLFTIAQGDTTIKQDLLIKNVFSNKIAYLGDKFSIQVDIAAQNCNSNASAMTISKVTEGGTKRLSSDNIQINKNDFFTTKELILDADQVGLVRYRVALSPVAGEVTRSNNYKDIYIEVLDARQKILLLAHGPHPDLAALKATITSNKNYEVDIHYPEDDDLDVAKYDLAVLHNLPSDKYSIAVPLATIEKRRIPKLFIIGASSSLAGINKAQDLVKISGNSTSLEDIQADVVSSFNSFTVDPQLENKLKAFPPLIAPFGQYTTPSAANALLTQNIKKIPTNYPLLSFQERNGAKTGVWVGEGIWKWRLFNHLQDQNYDITTSLVNKTIQYLSTKEDKRRFRVSSAKNLYKENERILFDAQLYNDNYEMVNDPDVFLTIKNAEGKEYKYTYSRSNNYYTLSVGMLPAGSYRYTAKVNYAGEASEQKGTFSVENIQLELYDLTARHDILRALSDKYGGEVLQSGNTSALASSLINSEKIKPVVYQSTETKSVINFKWLFGLLLFLLCLEWFLRRYFGSY